MENMPEVKLSDGRVARFARRPKASDAARAHRAAGPRGTDIDRSCAYMARFVEVEGAAVTMEDLLDLPMDDYEALVNAIPSNFS